VQLLAATKFAYSKALNQLFFDKFFIFLTSNKFFFSRYLIIPALKTSPAPTVSLTFTFIEFLEIENLFV